MLSVREQLYAMLEDVNRRMLPLQKERDEILRHLNACNAKEHAKMSAMHLIELIKNAPMSYPDEFADETLDYVKAHIFPIRHDLDPCLFNKTLQAIGTRMPTWWTGSCASRYMSKLAVAINNDQATWV